MAPGVRRGRGANFLEDFSAVVCVGRVGGTRVVRVCRLGIWNTRRCEARAGTVGSRAIGDGGVVLRAGIKAGWRARGGLVVINIVAAWRSRLGVGIDIGFVGIGF
jgi:hypothetical protein